MATSLIINGKVLRSDGSKHVATVSPGIDGGLCIEFSPAIVASLRSVDDGNGVAWLIDRDTANRLTWAMQEHKGDPR